MHHTKKVEEYEEIEIYVRFVPHGPYRLTSQPARVIMAKVKSRCYVTSKITEQFKNNRCTADGILFVFVHKALDDAVGEVQGSSTGTPRPSLADPSNSTTCITPPNAKARRNHHHMITTSLDSCSEHTYCAPASEDLFAANRILPKEITLASIN